MSAGNSEDSVRLSTNSRGDSRCQQGCPARGRAAPSYPPESKLAGKAWVQKVCADATRLFQFMLFLQ